MKVQWTPRARQELADIFAYYLPLTRTTAVRLADRIQQSIGLLEQFPQLGRLSEDKSCRLLQVAGLPYLIPYRIEGQILEIIAVFDERQDRPDEWQ
jgi:toxin ParE1/3/4